MTNDRVRYFWIMPVAVLFFSVLAGVAAYDAGVSHGLARAAAADGAAPTYYWRPTWGFGFPGVFLFLFFWMWMGRLFFWGGRWRRRGYGYGDGPWGYRDPDFVPADFDEWHRRAHNRSKENPPADDPGRR